MKGGVLFLQEPTKMVQAYLQGFLGDVYIDDLEKLVSDYASKPIETLLVLFFQSPLFVTYL